MVSGCRGDLRQQQNHLPVARDDLASTAVNTPVRIEVLQNDDFGKDGAGSRPLAIVQKPQHGNAVVDDGGSADDPTDDGVVYTPATGFSGSDHFVYEICDADGDCDEAKVSVSILKEDSDDAPKAVDDSATTSENTPVTIKVLGNDSFGDDGPGSVSISKDPLHGRAVVDDNGTASNAGDDTVVYTPANGYTGSDSFEYRICDADGDCDEAKVSVSVLEAASDEAVYVFAAGDIAENDTNNKNDDATAGVIEDRSHDLKESWYVLALGDLAYKEGTYQELKAYYDPSWGRFKKNTYPVPGNHEYKSGGKGFFEYWEEVEKGRTNPEYGWYAVDLGDWRLYALNSNLEITSGSDQYEWLEQDLKDNPTDCIIVIDHHPRFSPGSHGDNSEIDDVWDLLLENGGDVFLSGHDHLYARYKPLDSAGAVSEDGMVQFVVGTGGIHLYSASSDDRTAYVEDTDYGVLELKLEKGSYSWNFVNIDGETMDRGSRNCRSAAR